MILTTSQQIVIEDILRNAEPKYSSKLIEEGIFDKFNICLNDYVLSLTADQKRQLIAFYSGEKIIKTLIDVDKEFIKLLSTSLCVEDGMLLNSLINTGLLSSEELLEIAKTTSLVTVLNVLAKTHDRLVIDYLIEQDTSKQDIDLLEVLSTIDNQAVQLKIAQCVTNNINNDILHNVARMCLPSLHEEILENPFVTKEIKYTLKEKETAIRNIFRR